MYIVENWVELLHIYMVLCYVGGKFVVMKLLIQSQTSTVAPLKFRNG